MILILKHISIEGPGSILNFFEGRGIPVKILELQEGDALPESLDDIQAIVSLGGPMNVYEEDEFGFLKPENEFFKKALAKDLPVLGICLGSQLITKALNGKVVKSPEGEIGWFPVELTEHGKDDMLFEGLDDKFNVFHWHNDMSEVSTGSTVLIKSLKCPVQAFKYKNNVYGLQFHIEVNQSIIESWIKKYFKVEDAKDHPDGMKMVEEYARYKTEFEAIANKLYTNFLRLIK